MAELVDDRMVVLVQWNAKNVPYVPDFELLLQICLEVNSAILY